MTHSIYTLQFIYVFKTNAVFSDLLNFLSLISWWQKIRPVVRIQAKTMEGGAYNPYPSSVPGRLSRIERDLSTSPHNPGAYLNARSNIKMIRRILHEGRKPRVCIVGAGISGLRCATILARKGLRVTILEARDRVGGRVRVFKILLRSFELTEVRSIKVISSVM